MSVPHSDIFGVNSVQRSSAIPLFLVLVTCLAASASPAATEGPFDDCIENARRHRDDPEAYACLSEIAGRTNLWHELTERLRAHLSNEPDDHPARVVLARALATLGDPTAEGEFRSAIDGLAATENVWVEVGARRAFVSHLLVTSRAPEAAIEVEALERLTARVGDPLLRAAGSISKAQYMIAVHRYGDAERVLKGCRDVVFERGWIQLKSGWYSDMARVHFFLARYRDSLDLYRDQAAMLRAAEIRYEEALALSNAALLKSRVLAQEGLLNEPGRREELLSDFRAALRAAVESGNRSIEASAHNFLGQAVVNAPEKRKHFRRALEIHRQQGEMGRALWDMRHLGESFFDEPRDVREGYRLLALALTEAKALGSRLDIINAHLQLGHTSLRLHRHGVAEAPLSPDKAIGHLLSATQEIEKVRDLQTTEQARARTFSRRAEVYGWIVGSLLWPPEEEPSSDDLDLAFRTLERLRGRTLLAEMDVAGATRALRPAGSAATRHDEALRSIADLQRRIGARHTRGPEKTRLLRELEIEETRLAEMRAEMLASDATFANLRAPDPPSLYDIRHGLKPGEALFSFLLQIMGDSPFTGGSWVLVVTRDGTRAHHLPDEPEIEEAVNLLLGALQARDGSDAAAAAALHEKILAKALDTLAGGIDRLIIIPDGPLHRIPFGVLRASDQADPLGLRYEITVAPSAAVWKRLREGVDGGTAARPALAFVDPELPFAGVPAAGDSDEETATYRAAVLDRWRELGGLPHARRESRAISRHLGWGSSLREGAEASEASLKSSPLENFGLLHFGTHALVDGKNPDRSAVLLSPGSASEDGLLQVREIVGLDLDLKLVVLSACDSATGEMLEGEGMMSLARAFLVGGARSVVGSLWPLRDDEAAAFFEEFYRQLGSGRSVAEAIRGARVERSAAGAATEAWSGIVALGDGTFVPYPGGASRVPQALWLAVGGSLTLLLVAAAGMLVRRRRARVTDG
jgi:CHAT domain-containing protein/tetratricopeptide (TPR) repeat protein